MRIARLMSFSKDYVAYRYGADEQLASMPYEAQKAAFFSDFYVFSNSWEYWLREAGVEAFDVPFAVPALDDAYLREKGGQAPRDGSIGAAIEVLRDLKPDVVFLSSLERWDYESIARIREEVPSVRGILGMAGVNVQNPQALSLIDSFVTCMKAQAERLREDGLDARFMPHAFEPRILDAVPPTERTIDFAFFGNVFDGAQWHDFRRRVLHELVKECGLILYSSTAAGRSGGTLRKLAMTGAYWTAKVLPTSSPMMSALPFGDKLRSAANWPGPPSWSSGRELAGHTRTPRYGLGMYRELAATRLTVNVHIGAAGPYAANMRLFEATGMGTCLLTDAKSDIREFFEPDKEIVTFESVGDAVAKAKALLANPERTEEIGRAGQRRTLRDHTYQQRVPTVIAAAKAALERGTQRRPALAMAQ